MFTMHHGWRLSTFHLIEHRRRGNYSAGTWPIWGKRAHVRSGQLGVCLGHGPPVTYTDWKLLRLSASPPLLHAALDSSSAHSTKLLAGVVQMTAGSALEIPSLASSSLLLATLNAHAAHATESVLRPVSTAAESTLHKT